jgi:hypothetical protein
VHILIWLKVNFNDDDFHGYLRKKLFSYENHQKGVWNFEWIESPQIFLRLLSCVLSYLEPLVPFWKPKSHWEKNHHCLYHTFTNISDSYTWINIGWKYICRYKNIFPDINLWIGNSSVQYSINMFLLKEMKHLKT